MNIEQLRRILADLPGDIPVVVEDAKAGWMEGVALYLVPAHIERRISGNFVYSGHLDGADNCHALLMSAFGQHDQSVVEITPPPALPKVIDGETETRTAPRPQLDGDQR
jgi:hypothetical protein